MDVRVGRPPNEPRRVGSRLESAAWADWREAGDDGARAGLLELHLPWARLVARDVYRRVRLRQMEWADYAHYATVGLLEAMQRFDERRGVDFRTYARHRVRGAVFNGLRGFRGSANSMDRAARLDERRDSLLEGRDAESDALGEIARVTIELALGMLLEEHAFQESVGEACSGYRAAESAQATRMVKELMGGLPARERQVLELHYYQHVPFTEIASLLGVTKGRVSQIHHRALDRLRETWAGLVGEDG